MADKDLTTTELKQQASQLGRPNVKALLEKARFRLKSSHFITGDKYLLGDTETQDKGEEMGTVVGAGTGHEIRWPTLEMVALNEEAEQLLELERARLAANDATMNPIEDMPLDSFEQNWVPGLNVRRREPAEDGAPVKR